MVNDASAVAMIQNTDIAMKINLCIGAMVNTETE